MLQEVSMSGELRPSQRVVHAPQPSVATAAALPNRVLSVVLESDEDVDWIWTAAGGVRFVSGYTIVKKQDRCAQDQG